MCKISIHKPTYKTLFPFRISQFLISLCTQTLETFEGEVLSCWPFSFCHSVTGISAEHRVLAAINLALRQPPSLPSTARHQVCLLCSLFFFPSLSISFLALIFIFFPSLEVCNYEYIIFLL